MAEGLVLAIEGGGTHTRVVLGGEWGGVMRETRGGPGSALYVDATHYPLHLSGLITEVLRSDAVARIGCAGPMDRALVNAALAKRLPGVPVTWFSEGEIALGVYALDWGATVVGGTGSSARATAPGGAWVEVGGFGPQFDDLGSAYWIAREAIGAALRAEHGRAPATALREALFQHFNIANPWALVPLCEGNGHLSVTRVAAFAREVAACANAGDSVARDVLAQAGIHLADLVLAATARAGISTLENVPVVPTGGVFRAGESVLQSFEARLRAAGFDFRRFGPVPDPVIGLLNLLTRD